MGSCVKGGEWGGIKVMEGGLRHSLDTSSLGMYQTGNDVDPRSDKLEVNVCIEAAIHFHVTIL